MAADGRQPTASDCRPMRADARRNYDRLLATARETFAEHGTEAPLDDIARRAGVGAGTLYRHFPNRKALMEAVYRDDIDRLARGAYELLEQYPPAEALSRWMRGQVDYVLHRRGLATALKAVLDEDSETFALCKTTLRAAAAALLERAQRTGAVRADVTAQDLLRLGHAVGLVAAHEPEDLDRYLAILLDGLKPPR